MSGPGNLIHIVLDANVYIDAVSADNLQVLGDPLSFDDIPSLPPRRVHPCLHILGVIRDGGFAGQGPALEVSDHILAMVDQALTSMWWSEADTDEFLRPKSGTIEYYRADLDHPVAGIWSIEIPLEPFSADDEFDPATFRPGPAGPEIIDTAIVLDFIKLPAEELTELSQRTFTFPVNPEDGYIDGSIYLIAAHCPLPSGRHPHRLRRSHHKPDHSHFPRPLRLRKRRRHRAPQPHRGVEGGSPVRVRPTGLNTSV